VLAGFGLDTTGCYWRIYNGSLWLLLWLVIAVAGASPSRISQCPRSELVVSAGKIRDRRKSRITDERAIFHPMTRVWTT